MRTEATCTPTAAPRGAAGKVAAFLAKSDPWREGRAYIEAQRAAGQAIDRRVLAEITGFLASTNTALIEFVLGAEHDR